MLNVFRFATAILLFSLAVFSQQPSENKPPASSTNPCASAPNKTERTACWQDLARKAKAYLAGDPCPDTTTDMERTNCWLDIATRANARLAANYQTVQKAIKTHMAQQPSDFRASDERALAGLKTAQLAWTRYRDSQCNAAEQRYEGGAIAPSIRAVCERDLAEQRMEELHQTYAMYLVNP
jgi:uncharacterized protein YecT (DUF1311 family)